MAAAIAPASTQLLRFVQKNRNPSRAATGARAMASSNGASVPRGLPIDLRGKRTFIAGVADDQGFGWAIAKALAATGAEILVASLVKPLFDSVVALPLDDPPLALAAATVLHFLALDGQNEELFDSAPCVRFLMGLLGSSLSRPTNKAISTVGNKLAGLAFRLKSGNVSSGVDKAGAAVVAEVHKLFAKDEKSPFGHLNKDETSGLLLGQEVSSKWLALLTVAKARISLVVLEDKSYLNYRYSTHFELMDSWVANNSGAAQRMSGFFRERLRELGGLDTICDLGAACLRNIRVFEELLWELFVQAGPVGESYPPLPCAVKLTSVVAECI